MPVFDASTFQMLSRYPNIDGADWCGEWKPSKELQVLLDKYSKEEL
jgi:hypothetical protein